MTDTERQELIGRLERAETSDEIAEIEAALGLANDDRDERWLMPTLATVAEFFAVHEQTIKGWRSEGLPESDGGWNLREIVRWRIARAEKRGADTDESSRALMREKLRLDIERRQLELNEQKGLLIRKDEALADITEVFAIMRTRAEAWPAEIASSFPPELRDSLLVDLKAKVRSFLKELAAIGLAADESETMPA